MRTGQPVRTPVLVHAEDPVSRAGVEAQLRCRPEIELVADGRPDRARVAVVVVSTADDDALQVVRELRRTHAVRVLLLAEHLDDASLLTAVEAGVTTVLRRAEATPERLAATVESTANGDGSLPPDLVSRLLMHLHDVQHHVLRPKGLTIQGLSQRELAVLRLVADGCSTQEIAQTLSYSERTIKNSIHELVTRLQLRNRSHAVAFAVRAGLI
jgi:DNA-binding NarL/FixJ family response regulator